jgi:hypothetical protein
VTFFSEPTQSPTKNKNLDYKILYKTFLPFFLHDSDNNRKFAADKIRKLMKEYIKPELNVYQMETTSILAGSEIVKAKEEDYSEESVSDYRDSSGSIWAD